MSTFRGWNSGNVTALRAQELWLKGVWRLNSLMSVLKTDVQEMENGDTLLWYLDEQHTLIEAALIKLTYETWDKDEDYPVDPESGAMYSELPNPQDRFSLFVESWVDERMGEVRTTVESGDVDPDKPWTIGQWFAEDEITARTFLLRTTAGLWMPFNLVEAATLPAQRMFADTIRGEIGEGYESGAQWDAFVVQAYETARDVVVDYGRSWIQNGQAGLDNTFEAIAKIVEDSGEKTYEDGVIYRALGISCAEATAMIRELETMIPGQSK